MPTEKLRREHGAAQYVLNRLEAVTGELESLPETNLDQMAELMALLGFMTRFDRCHCLKTEEALLPALEARHVDISGTALSGACLEHMHLCTLLSKLKRRLPRVAQDAPVREQFVQLAHEYIEGMRQHMTAADHDLEHLEREVLTEADELALYDALGRYEQDNKWLAGKPLLLEEKPGDKAEGKAETVAG